MKILDVNISPTSYLQASQLIREWANHNESRYVCAANVHMVMEAHDSSQVRDVVNNADLVTPDGMPLVWVMRRKGVRNQERVYGPTLMLEVLKMAQENGIPVGFFGGSQIALKSLVDKMTAKYPGLKICLSQSPPYSPISQDEDKTLTEGIIKSGARILFVGLGCPKQEIWMAEHRTRIPAVMIGVGAAFDFHAGLKPQAPEFIQKIGLEWLFRLFHEPIRLWRRYILNNPRFIVQSILDIMGFYHPL